LISNLRFLCRRGASPEALPCFITKRSMHYLQKIGICDFPRALTLQHSESGSLLQRSPESRDWHLKRGSRPTVIRAPSAGAMAAHSQDLSPRRLPVIAAVSLALALPAASRPTFPPAHASSDQRSSRRRYRSPLTRAGSGPCFNSSPKRFMARLPA